jgi:hypothetical protein
MPDDFYSQKMAEATMALQVMARLVVPEFDEFGTIHLRTVSKEEWEASQVTTPSSTPKLIPVQPSVRKDGSTPFVWVFICPPPYNGVEIVCVPDGTTEVGIRCTASAPNKSREKDKFQIVFVPDQPGTHVVVMDGEEFTEYQDYMKELDQER